MKIKETQTKPVEVIIKTLCDKCNKEIKSTIYNAFESTFHLRQGQSYSDGGSGVDQEMDLCESCSEDLFAKLEKEGYRINKSEWDI